MRLKFFPIEKNGICTKHGVKMYCEKFMQNGSNHLFGKAFGNEIGLSNNKSFSNRSNNVLVVGGTGTGKTYNYIASNLLQENHSAVVVDNAGVLYAKYGEYLRKKGHNVYYIDFDNPEISCRFNPFLNHTERTEHREAAIDIFVNSFAYACKNNKELPQEEHDIYIEILTLIFGYVLYSPLLSDKQRNFKRVQMIADELQQFGKNTVEKYKCDNLLDKAIRILKSAPDDVFNRAVVTILNDLNIFAINPSIDPDETIFTENENAINLSIEDFVSKQSYLFIKTTPQGDNRVSFFLPQIFNCLRFYGEEHPSEQCEAMLENHIQFYLDEFANLNFGNFTFAISICRPYNIGFSVIVNSLEQLVHKYKENDEWEIIHANTDTKLFTGSLVHLDEIEHTIGKRLFYSNGKPVEYGSSKKTVGVIGIPPMTEKPILNVEEIKKIFSENKQIVIIRDCYPIICDKLNPADYESK